MLNAKGLISLPHAFEWASLGGSSVGAFCSFCAALPAFECWTVIGPPPIPDRQEGAIVIKERTLFRHYATRETVMISRMEPRLYILPVAWPMTHNGSSTMT